MNFTIKCNECGCTDIAIDIFNESMVLTCGGCSNEQLIVTEKEE